MRVGKALEQISEIHAHMARSQVYRGYRAVPVMLSGALALAAGWIQPRILASTDARSYLIYWTAVAVAAFLISGGNVIYGYLREENLYARQRTLSVVGQLAPSLAVGLVVTLALGAQQDGRYVALLPGIWALLYGLGLLASRPFLPRMIGWLGLFYILCGAVLLQRAAGGADLSPWAVAAPFGTGQILGGLILHWNLERRRHDF